MTKKKKTTIFGLLDDALEFYLKIKNLPEFNKLKTGIEESLPEVEQRIKRTRKIIASETKEIITRSIPVAREPLADIINDGKIIRVLIELPGIRVEDIHIEYRKPAVIVNAVDYANRKIEGVFKLPDNCEYNLDLATSTFKNGILECSIPILQLEEFSDEDFSKEGDSE